MRFDEPRISFNIGDAESVVDIELSMTSNSQLMIPKKGEEELQPGYRYMRCISTYRESVKSGGCVGC